MAHRSKAWRLHQRARYRRMAHRIVSQSWGAQPTRKRVGKCLHSRTPCSCPMCGNPRRHFRGKNRLTLQERRA